MRNIKKTRLVESIGEQAYSMLRQTKEEVMICQLFQFFANFQKENDKEKYEP